MPRPRRGSEGSAPRTAAVTPPAQADATPPLQQQSPRGEGKPLIVAADPSSAAAAAAPHPTRDIRAATMPVNAPQPQAHAIDAAAADVGPLRARILVLGAPGSGRRSLLRRWLTGKFGADAGTKESARKAVALPAPEAPRRSGRRGRRAAAAAETAAVQRLADVEVAAVTGGLENSVLDTFIRMSDAFALTFALDDPASLEAARQWHARIQLAKGIGRKLRCALVACKADVEPQTVPAAAVRSMAAELGTPVIETSAATGANVDKAFLGLVQSCVEPLIAPKQPEEQQQQQQQPKKLSWLASILGKGRQQQSVAPEPRPPAAAPQPAAVVKVRQPLSEEDLLGIVIV